MAQSERGQEVLTPFSDPSARRAWEREYKARKRAARLKVLRIELLEQSAARFVRIDKAVMASKIAARLLEPFDDRLLDAWFAGRPLAEQERATTGS